MPSHSEDMHPVQYNSDGADVELMNRPESAGATNRSFVDSFLAPASAGPSANGGSRHVNNRVPDPTMRATPRHSAPRRNPVSVPYRSPAPVTSFHPVPSDDLHLRDIQPLDRDDEVEVELKSSSPVVVAVAVTDDGDTGFRNSPPLAVVRQPRNVLHVPAHFPLPPVRLQPTLYRQQHHQAPPPRQRQQNDG